MRKNLLFVAVLSLCNIMPNAQDKKDVDQGYCATAVPASTNVPNASFPAILPDSRVNFRIAAPDAKQIQVDLGKKYEMQRDAEGVWTCTTEPQSPGFHYYSILIDGVATYVYLHAPKLR